MKGNPTFCRGTEKKIPDPIGERQAYRDIGRFPSFIDKASSTMRELSLMAGSKVGGKKTRGGFRTFDSYSLCSDDVGTSSAGTCVFCRRRSGMPPPFFGAKLGHIAGCTMLMQSIWAFALQLRHRTPWRLWPRSTWPHASHGVILRYVYSRQVCPPSDSRLFLWKQSPLFMGFSISWKSTCACSLACYYYRSYVLLREECIKSGGKNIILPRIKFKSNVKQISRMMHFFLLSLRSEKQEILLKYGFQFHGLLVCKNK